MNSEKIELKVQGEPSDFGIRELSMSELVQVSGGHQEPQLSTMGAVYTGTFE